MTVKEYLEKVKAGKYQDITFIKARARKDASTPFYHAEYQTTPIFKVVELENSKLMEYYVLNNKQQPIDWLSGVPWKNAFNSVSLISLLVISDDDFALLYQSKEQRNSMIKFIDKAIMENL